MQTYQRLQEVEHEQMIREAEGDDEASDVQLGLDLESRKRDREVREIVKSALEIKQHRSRPQNELEAVTVQIDELQQIRVIAEKLKELRQIRDKEKQVFDAEVEKLTQIREEINSEKQKMKDMYKQAGI